MPKRSLEDVYEVEDIISKNIEDNNKERGRAKGYFNSIKTPNNLIKAAYHYYKSVPGLGGKSEHITYGGIAPNPTIGGNIEKEFNLINKAQQEVKKAKELYNKFINSPEYLQRIKDGHRIKQIQEFYNFAKEQRIKKSDPLVKEYARLFTGKEPTTQSLIDEFNIRHAKALEQSRKEHLVNKEYDEILNKIKQANDDKNGIIYQDVIRYRDNEGIEHIFPSYKGLYRGKTDNIHISTNTESPINTYIHENSHRTYNRVKPSNFQNGLNNNNIKIKSYLNFTDKDKRYYEDFDEAISRTLNALSQMYDQGYPLSYKGFKDWTRKTSGPEHINELNVYDNNTIKHLINLMYKNGGRISLTSII